MQAKGHPLQDFDLVVQTFAEAVGFAVLPAVLDVAPPVADSAGGRVDLLYIGGGILFDPFCQLLILDRVGPGSKDIVEELKGIIGFQKIRSHFKGILELALIAEPHIVHHFIESLDDVEGVDTDPGVREVLSGDRDKAVAHVTAEVFHPFPLL